GAAKSHDHRTHHLEPERKEARCASRCARFLENVLPDGVPPRAPELLRPIRTAPAAPVQRLLPADRLVARDFLPLEHFAPRLRRDVRFDEGADFVAEGELLL